MSTIPMQLKEISRGPLYPPSLETDADLDSDSLSLSSVVRPRRNEKTLAVATAAQFGVFRVEGERDDRVRAAEHLADQIRVYKGIDPTLGVYAAYAYADADLIEQVRSVQQYMRRDLQTEIFDVAMLSGSLSEGNDKSKEVFGSHNDYGPVPFCPMLSQGWSLLRVRACPRAGTSKIGKRSFTSCLVDHL